LNVEILAKIAAAGIALLIVGVVLAFPVYILWNYALVDAVTWANPIGFWQPLGVALLIGMFRTEIKSKDD
jgi:hypothetical protein